MTRHTLVGGLACMSSLKRWFTSQTLNMNAKVSLGIIVQHLRTTYLFGLYLNMFVCDFFQIHNCTPPDNFPEECISADLS